ncbi:MAG: hypothetical protein QG614_342 [Patescibacteria group bacterium]|nr:hypothetical protein [Patescibacteria group bacterium]
MFPNSNSQENSISFSSPEEEIQYLRSKIKEKEELVINMPRSIEKEEIAKSTILEHKGQNIENVAANADKHNSEVQNVIKNLTPKNDDKQVLELADIMLQKGVRFSMDVVSSLRRPELEDNFHRFLVNYLLSGHINALKDMSKKEWKALHLKLFEITPPPFEEEKDTKSAIQMMEQLYAALQMIANDPENSKDNYYSLELAIANGSNEVVFYMAVPMEIENILEKTLQGYFPGIQVREKKDDYNIFNDSGYQMAAVANLHDSPALPIRTYNDLEGDPITVIINSFAKLKEKGEGAAMQILVRPVGDRFKKSFISILDSMNKNGDNLKKALDRQSGFGGVMIDLKEAFFEQEKKENSNRGHVDGEHLKLIGDKLKSTILDTNIRLFASSESVERTRYIMNDMKASFKQYTENNGNYIEFKDYENTKLVEHVHDFIYRLWKNEESLPLNLSELATLYHVPINVKDFVQVKVSKMVTAPAPLDLPHEGVLLGYNEFRDIKMPIHMLREDRVRHLYVIGQTGTGKTTILKNLIIQDIQNGDGCCFIDPHGSDIDDILANIPPERLDDVIYFDPSYTKRPMGLNMLEYDPEFPEMKTFVINELLSIFNKLFDMKSQGGAGFEAMFRNATQLVMEHPESGNTLLEISRVLSDKDFRDYKLSKSKNPLIHQYWKNAESTSGEQGLSNWVPYINSKIDPFLTNDIMRPIIAQEESSFNIREIMDKKKIFLVNLSKGKLGELNSYLLGLILVGKFAQAALSRVNVPVEQRPDFYLYLDEFQNITTPAISSILSEARKYRLSLNIAHQFLGQLPEDIKSAVFGNIGSMCVYRVGPEDAQFLEKQFAPTFTASDIMRISNFHCYMKLLSNSVPQKPFSMSVSNNPKGDISQINMIKEVSYEKYGRPREEVEDEILEKYNL